MTTESTTIIAASTASDTTPDAASTINAPSAAAKRPQAVPEPTAASPDELSKPAPNQLDQTTAALRQTMLLHQLLRLRRRHWMPRPPAKPFIGEHDLLVEGCLKLAGRAGPVITIPLNTLLPGALSAAFIPMAQQQFETVLDQLFIKPATVAFISHLELFKPQKPKSAHSAKQNNL